ncbi:hypothetical protein L2E82_24740 [Cichorium intybus]|uniref:Uncharacterized protein n=1 Tax=Cichorium intybus TaxID=13427 RepID=A0ACB9E1B8_CICIN|nr:hypothetical protein L2E82_24740 [Cichorium intybus]
MSPSCTFDLPLSSDQKITDFAKDRELQSLCRFDTENYRFFQGSMVFPVLPVADVQTVGGVGGVAVSVSGVAVGFAGRQ